MVQNTTGYIHLDDGKVYYEVAGQGAPLLFLHAGFVDRRMWDGQWSDFSRRYAAIRFDMRGFGKSDAVETPVSRCRELYHVLRQTAAPTILVGCSLGGEAILDLALEHPEMVSGLILVSAVPSGFEMQGEPPPHLLEMMAAVQQGDLATASELQMRIWIDGPYRQPEQVNPEVRRRAAEMNRTALKKQPWAIAVAPPSDSLQPAAVQRLDQIDAPTLIIGGELDNPEILRAADLMADTIPGAHKAIIPDSAHLPNMENPTAFNQAVLGFLQTTESPPHHPA